ncbi:MAG: LapA family protein [Nitrosomonadales bacterium]|nr:LapA family protein [Nitrosomonadales bacterium]
MPYLIWLLRAALFLMLLGLALKNDQPVVVRYFFGSEWHASLVVVMLLFFAAGMGVGILALLGNIFRQRREIAALKRDLRLKNKLAGVGETQQMPIQPS